MTQEEKQLLLKDLCARLSYGVKVLNTAEGLNKICKLDSIMTARNGKDCFVGLTLPDDSIMTGIEMVKPYLRPMSSMTEEEKEEISQKLNYEFYVDEDAALCTEDERHRIRLDLIEVYIDWLNKNHFDYRGFIEKGLAIEAAEGMYNITK